VEQFDAEPFLQRLDVGGDHRLGDEEMLGRPGHASELDDETEDLELLKADAVVVLGWHDSISL
jgi:hypothetical protein